MVWFLAILFTIPAFWIIQRYWTSQSLKGIAFQRSFDRQAIFSGEKVNLTLSLGNFKLLPLPWIRITADIPETFRIQGQKIYETKEKLSNEHAIITSLRSYERLTRIHEVEVTQRGYYTLLDVKIAAGDYYGFLKSEQRIHMPLNLTVYPLIKPVESLLAFPKKAGGQQQVRRWILPDVMDVVGSRDYTYNEPFSDIDWLATARVGKMQVKQYAFNAKKSAMIFLDVRTHTRDWKFKDRELIEHGIEIAAGLTEVFYQEKVDFGFATNSKLLGSENRSILGVDHGLGQKMRVLEMLARMSYYQKQDFSEFIRFNYKKLKVDDVIFYVTAYLNEASRAHLNHLSAKGFKCKIIYLKERADNDRQGLRPEIDLLYMERGDSDA